MQQEIKISEDKKYLIANFEGNGLIGDFLKGGKAIADECKERDIHKVLIDSRKLKANIGALDCISLINSMKRMDFDDQSRFAFLYSDNDDIYQFIETAAINRGTILKVFKEKKEAYRWLLR